MKIQGFPIFTHCNYFTSYLSKHALSLSRFIYNNTCDKWKVTAEITCRQRTTFDDYGAHKRGGYNWATISTSATCLPNNGEPGTQKNGRDLVLMNQKLVRPKSQIQNPNSNSQKKSQNGINRQSRANQSCNSENQRRKEEQRRCLICSRRSACDL